jgi:hypothetical protein
MANTKNLLKGLAISIATLFCASTVLYGQTQVGSAAAALEAKVAADPHYSKIHNRIVQDKKRLKAAQAGKDLVEIYAQRSLVDGESQLLEQHIATDPKYRDEYNRIDEMTSKLPAKRRHHYVSNEEPK